MKTLTLTRRDALAAEAAIKPSRPWFGNEHATGTYHYAIDPETLPVEEEEVALPILDEGAQSAFLASLDPWAPGQSYTEGQLLSYNDAAIRVIAAHTSQADWTPDIAVALFSSTLLDDTIRPWRQPQGEHDAYPPEHVVSHDGAHWRNDLDIPNVWEPGTYGWLPVEAEGSEDWGPPPDEEPEYPAWAQPIGTHDAYPFGYVVTHNGNTWQSTHNGANSWEPGVFGWEII